MKSSWQVERSWLCNKVFRLDYQTGEKEYREHYDYFPNGFPTLKITTYFLLKHAKNEACFLNSLGQD